MSVRPAKTQSSLGIRPVWSESSLSVWRNLRSLATYWAHSKDSDQTGRHMILLVLTCCGSFSVALNANYGFSSLKFVWRVSLSMWRVCRPRSTPWCTRMGKKYWMIRDCWYMKTYRMDTFSSEYLISHLSPLFLTVDRAWQMKLQQFVPVLGVNTYLIHNVLPWIPTNTLTQIVYYS